MDYVNKESAELARSWEKRFAELPAKAGITFVSVNPQPTSDGRCRVFTIILGLDRNLPFDESTGQGIIAKVLTEELKLNFFTILGHTFRGVSGGAHVSP